MSARFVARPVAPQPARVSLQEPEAVNQRTKDNMRRLAYKPVVLANADKLIVGQGVEPSNEILAIEPMIEQHRAVFGSTTYRRRQVKVATVA